MNTIEVKTTKRVPVAKLFAQCGVRYWEDASVNGVEDEDGSLIPCRLGDMWRPTINLETGQIEDWPEGTTASIHYKVCDAGVYTLLSESGEHVATKDGYVPSMLSPKDNGFGDYIIMDIGADGVIENWSVDLTYFEEDDE